MTISTVAPVLDVVGSQDPDNTNPIASTALHLLFGDSLDASLSRNIALTLFAPTEDSILAVVNPVGAQNRTIPPWSMCSRPVRLTTSKTSNFRATGMNFYRLVAKSGADRSTAHGDMAAVH